MEVQGYARTNMGRRDCRVDDRRVLDARVGQGAVGDVWAGGDDAGHERHAEYVEHACGHGGLADRFGGSPGGRHRGRHRQLRLRAGDADRPRRQHGHLDEQGRGTAHGGGQRRVVPFARNGFAGNVFVHLPEGGDVRVRLLDPPVHACHGGGHVMTDDPHTMNRRQLMRHSAWFGAAVGLAVVGGEVVSHVAGSAEASHVQRPTLRFAQVSDSHIGFLGKANPNVAGSFGDAIDRINNLGYTPDFVIHTGDLTHLATAEQFDQVKQMMGGLHTQHVFTVPGEHDSIDDGGQKYRSAFGAGTRGDGWYSFDIAGVHVIALVNTLNLKKLGHLGVEQLDFVQKDVSALPSDTPIIVFSHIPLFAMFPDWGWGTDDATEALSHLRRFSSVTCLNGHVHQVFSKTEGNVTFYSGTTTAYPLPHPGDGPAPKPVTLPAGKLHDALGIREVSYTRGQSALALKEKALQ